MANKVLVIGGGVAGLTAASELAELDIDVEIVERSDFAGGHAIQYACKATDQCVKCGACMVGKTSTGRSASENQSQNGHTGSESNKSGRFFGHIIKKTGLYRSGRVQQLWYLF